MHIFKGKANLIKDHQIYHTVNSNKLQINVSKDHIRNPKGEVFIDFNHHHEKNRFKKKKTFAYINNPEGKMQWIFPINLQKPLFLDSPFSDQYNYFQRNLIQCSYKTGLKSLIRDGIFTVYYDSTLYLEEILNYFSYTEYLISASFDSWLKTIYITTFTNSKPEFHIKLAMNAIALGNIFNEYNILKKLNRETYQYFNVPGCLQFEDQNFIIRRDQANCESEVSPEISRKHVLALNELYRESLDHQYLSQLLQECNIRLKYVEKLIRTRPVNVINRILNKTNQLMNSLSPFDQLIPVGLMNGNFAPPNIGNDDKITLFNWELASYDKPLLSDLFHYVMINKSKDGGCFEDVKNEIDRLYQQTYVRALVQSYQIDYFLHFQLYLLGEISYHLPFLVEEIDFLTTGAKNNMNIWLQALEAMVPDRKPVGKQLTK